MHEQLGVLREGEALKSLRRDDEMIDESVTSGGIG